MKKVFSIGNSNNNLLYKLKVFAILFCTFLFPAIGIGQTYYLNDDFEDNNITGWTAVTNYAASNSTPIAGTYSLKNTNTAAGSDYIYYPFSGLNISSATTIWRFQLRNGAFDPSTGNKFWVYLIANETNLGGSTVDGYAVGVNLTGSTDMLTLWKVTDGAAVTALVTSTLDWNASMTVGIEVTRTSGGTWELKYDSNGGFDALTSAGTAVNTDYTTASYFGLNFVFSVSYAGLLRMDDVSVSQPSVSCSSEPTVQATTITFSNVGTSGMDVSWTAGTGGDNYILVCRQGSAVTWTPTDNADYTGATGGGDFTSATDQGSGNKVVYDGSGTSATITGLSQGTTYYFQVFHYCENSSTEDYITSTGTNNTGAQNQATTTGPIKYQGFEGSADDNWNYSGGTISASTARFYVGAKSGLMDGAQTVTFDNVDISTYENVVLSVAFSANGPDSGDDLYLDISYDGGSTWAGTGSVKLVDGFGNANIAFGATNGADPTTVASNPWTVNISSSETQIQIRFRYLGGASGDIYYIDDISLDGDVATIDPEPTNQPTSFAVGTVTTSNIPLTWTEAVNGSTPPDGYLIKASTSAVSDPSDATDPANDLSLSDNVANVKVYPKTVTAYSSFTNFTVGTMYYFGIWSYTNSGTDINFKTDGEPTLNHATRPNSVTSPVFTATSSSTADISWTKATGHSDANHTTMVFVKATSSVTVGTPDNDDSFYTANTTFGSGTAYEGDANAKCVYKGDGTSVSISGLSASTAYYVLILNVVDATNSNTTNSYSSGATANVTTPCTNYTIPFTQGFNSTSIPACWSTTVVADPGVNPVLSYQASNTYPAIGSPQEGTQFVKFNSYNCDDGAEIRLISPPITTTGLSSINMDFIWFESPNYSTYLTEGMTVQYSLNGGSSWTDVEFFQRYNAVNGWKDKTCPLPSAINNQSSVLIGFLFHSEYGYDCVMDDVYIYTCTEPTTNPLTMTFSNVTSTTIDLSIGTPGDGTNRIIVARAGSDVSFTPTDLTTYDATAVFSDATDLGSGNKVIYNGTGTSVSISGLSGATTYYFKVFEYNCITGYENYYTGGTILSGNTTTAISPVTNLKVVCQTNTTAQISWTSPTGSYDGVIIGMRNSTLVPHAISDDAANYTADAAFGSGTQYGGTTPYSFVVYKGTGTSITVTGLTLGQSYSIKAYAYKNNTGSIWSTTQPTTSISSLGTVNVTGNFVLTDNTQLQLQWSNPDASCFDEVMIIGNAGAAITTQPTGDGSAYSANTVFGSGDAYGSGYVVYKGGFSPQIITNLTNGTEYCFTWFVRNGTSWSSGVSACGTPATVTILEPGDLAIVAVNTQATSSGSADEICFFAFKDITEGTSIDFTDNGYERLYDGKWASSEGTLRWTRTGGGTITAGKVICFQGMGYQQSGFSIFTCGVADDANWTLTSLNSAGSSNGSYDLNVDDQIWIIQGGAWDNTGDLAAHNATYSGNVLYGWTATGWEPVSGYDDTKGSTLYPETECFNTNVAVAANHSKVKYIGATSTTSQFAWLGRINDNANWLGYATNAAYYAGPDYSGTCYEFISNSAIIGTPGVWTGNDNEDWFDCGNWQNLRIPNGSANVIASGAVSNHITVDDGITSMPEAECNNLTIAADATVGGAPLNLKVNNASSVLNVYGDFTNNKTVTHTNGEIHYAGDFVNNGTYTHNTAGTAIFDGSGNQELTGTTSFYNLQMDNSSSGITLNNDITVNNILTLTDGLINTGTNKVVIENNALGATTGQSTASYVNGNLRRKVATGSYDFPVGTATNYEIANINLVTSTITYLDAKFTSPHSGTTLPTSPYLTINGTDLTELLDYGFWTISPVAGTSTNYDVTLTSRGHSNGGSVATQHTIVKRADGSSAWTSYESNHNNATQSGTGSNPILTKLSGMSGFSDFAIARSATYPLPVSLIYFTADWSGDNVILNWETASESNNDYFSIERSNNGVEFEEIGSIKGIGNSSIVNSYSFIDYSPLNGKSYYRLKQVDFNEKYVFSNIVSIFKKESDKLSVSSNYNSEYGISFIINNPSKQLINLRILDMSGKIVYLDKLNFRSENVILNIENGTINAGVYNLILYNSTDAFSRKIVILK